MSELSILQRVARGDADAVQECIDRYAPLVWSLARRLSPTTADAEDAVQDILTEVWRSADRFDPEIAGESTFVAMIARRRLINRLNRRARRINPVSIPEESRLDAASAEPRESALIRDEDAAAASEAFEQLNETQQRVLRLAIQHGYTHAQIADITGMPLGTVKTHIRRGLIRVREIIDEIRGAVGREVAL